MAAPLPLLFIPELDADHERLELMLAEAETVEPAAREAFFDAILTETAAHFDREEAFFARRGVKNLLCHRARHQLVLDLGRQLRQDAGLSPEARLDGFARALADHVFAMDRISAEQSRPPDVAGAV